MYSVDEIIEQIDGESEIEDNLEENSQENEETEDKDENAGSATKVEPKTKRRRVIRPKLDAERLKGPRGLMCIEKMFADIKFKGQGYEKQDLNVVMNNLQYWCHRLFPKFTFDDCLAQLEHLGTKKAVMTLRKKILYNMMEEEQPPQFENMIDEDVPESQQEAISEFDLLLNQQIPTSLPSTQPAVTAEVVELTDEQKEMIEKNRQLAAERRRARFEALKQKQEENELQISQQSQFSNSLPLTDEQRLTIERNRLLAVEKRKQLHNKTDNLSQNTEDIISNDSQLLMNNGRMNDDEEIITDNNNQTIEVEVHREQESIEISETNENRDMNVTNEDRDINVSQNTEENISNDPEILMNKDRMDGEEMITDNSVSINDNETIEQVNTEIGETNENQNIDITNENQDVDVPSEEIETENSEMQID